MSQDNQNSNQPNYCYFQLQSSGQTPTTVSTHSCNVLQDCSKSTISSSLGSATAGVCKTSPWRIAILVIAILVILAIIVAIFRSHSSKSLVVERVYT